MIGSLDHPNQELEIKLNMAEDKELYPWVDVKTRYFLLYNYKVFKEIRATQVGKQVIEEISFEAMQKYR